MQIPFPWYSGQMEKQNLVIVHTGNGKGKTTAALGLVWRSLGHGSRCAVVQFVKQHPERFGEYQFARSQGVVWETFGDGFVREYADHAASRKKALEGWEYVRRAVEQSQFDLLVLDEFTYPLQQRWLDEAEVLEWFRLHRGILPHLVITGRGASVQLIEAADIVTEMKEVKHCFSLQGTAAQRGIEY